MKLAVFLLLVFPCCLMASGNEPSIKDLLWPAVSFSTLFSILGYKLTKAMRKFFLNHAEVVKEEYTSAQASIEKATKSFEKINSKISNIENVKATIAKSFTAAVKEYEQKLTDDIQQQKARIEKETIAMIDYEKKKLEFELKKDLVDSVMDLAKEKIVGDKKKNEAVSANILDQI